MSVCVAMASLARSELWSSDPAFANVADVDENNETCTPPAIDEFPPDFMTPEMREKGGVVAHIVIGIYLIFVLGIICDDYFVPALEMICEKLNLKPDVAGATFMAAGDNIFVYFV